MIADDALGLAVFNQVSRDIAFATVNEARYHSAVAVEFRDRIDLVLVEKTLNELAVNLFADTPVLRVDNIIDGPTVRQIDMFEIAEYVIIVMGDLAIFGASFQSVGRFRDSKPS